MAHVDWCVSGLYAERQAGGAVCGAAPGAVDAVRAVANHSRPHTGGGRAYCRGVPACDWPAGAAVAGVSGFVCRSFCAAAAIGTRRCLHVPSLSEATTTNASLFVGYGSVITLQHVNAPHCWLHSHSERYPSQPAGKLFSSRQQQVTGYPFQDPNNEWIIEDPTNTSSLRPDAVRLLQQGDTLRLRHRLTGKTLNSHNVAGPLTHTMQEVSCYGPDDQVAPQGEAGHIAKHDVWKVEMFGQKGPRVRVAWSRFRLVHVDSDCQLQTSGKTLPEWAFHQLEVVAGQNRDDPATVWTIDSQHNPRLLNATVPPEIQTPVAATEEEREPLWFMQKVWELHFAMFKANSQLVAGHSYASRPGQWPLAVSGLSFWQGQVDGQPAQLYLLGNPPMWWLALGCAGLYVLFEVFYLLRRQRQVYDVPLAEYDSFTHATRLLCSGWLLHYLPFFVMGRQLFLHHYEPALVFSYMLAAVQIEHVFVQCFGSPRAFRVVCAVVIAAAAASFAYFAPFTYALPLGTDQILARKWLSTWTFQHNFEPVLKRYQQQ
eukprot:m.190617 g.190617  ORF g.190617 m.190617 type:complete len:542 (+) comp21705_c0_seq6:734-2359(+)